VAGIEDLNHNVSTRILKLLSVHSSVRVVGDGGNNHYLLCEEVYLPYRKIYGYMDGLR
jgi:hypothetical protein